MGRIVFVFESNKTSKSDYYYVRTLLGEFYDSSRYKPDALFAGSKTKLYSSKTKRDFEEIRNKELKINKHFTPVIIFADIDNQNKENAERNKEIVSFAKSNKCDVVWFNRDIEEVFIGRRVSDTLKVNTAKSFTFKHIEPNFKNNMHEANPFNQYKKSNLFIVLDKYLPKK